MSQGFNDSRIQAKNAWLVLDMLMLRLSRDTSGTHKPHQISKSRVLSIPDICDDVRSTHMKMKEMFYTYDLKQPFMIESVYSNIL